MKKIAFIFPGQGAQAVGMGKDVYEKAVTTKTNNVRAIPIPYSYLDHTKKIMGWQTDSDIFIKLTKPDGTESYFEATPASYEKREDGDDLSDYYGAYLNKEDAPSGSTAEVLISKNGGIYTTKKIVLEYN